MHLSGLNWGQLQLEQSSFRFNAPDNHSIINVDLCNLLGCNSSKNDITISLMDNPSQETFVLNEVRFSVPEKAEINNFTSNLQETLSKVNAMNSNDLMVAKFHHVSASAPSGIYSIEIFSNLIKLNSEKKKDAPVNIPHSNVQCMFLLPYPLGGKKYMCITLLTPIRINQTAFLHVVLLFDDSEFIDPDSPFTLEISQETISERFPSSPLNERMSGPKVEIFAKILKTMTKKKLFGQGEFRSNNGETSCISTVFRSANGFLYCLDKSLLFLHRPATFIRHEDILEIEMQGLESGNVNKNFIAIVSTKKGERFTFGSIDKRETSFVTEYLKKKNISVVMEGNSSGASVSESDDSSDEDSVEKKKRKV